MKSEQYKIGVFGSAAGEIEKCREKAKFIGRLIAERHGILITGATSGLPGICQKAAHADGGLVWGFSPGVNVKQHLERTPGDDVSLYTKLIYLPAGYEFKDDLQVCRKYRNVTSTATCDAGIIISGRWGTMNEFTNLFDMGKIIGVLTSTGGIADELPGLMNKISKNTSAEVIFENDPGVLIEKVYKALKARKEK